jgi:hypothetical protein
MIWVGNSAVLVDPIQLEVKSKICNFCSTWKKRNPGDLLPVPLHFCTMNHDGSSSSMESSMEAAAALTMIVDLFETKHASVARICIDDDASTPSMLKWSNADYTNNNNTTEPPFVPKTVGKNKGKLHPRPNNGKLPAHGVWTSHIHVRTRVVCNIRVSHLNRMTRLDSTHSTYCN